MDATKRMMPNMTLEEELAHIKVTLAEVEQQLAVWSVNNYGLRDLSADAVVALLDFAWRLRVREAYLEGWLQQESIPF